MKYAPVLISVYNRLNHLQRCVESLQENEWAKHTELFIVSDAPSRIEDIGLISDIREYALSVKGFKKVILLANDRNKGGDVSVREAINNIFEEYDRLIYMEDDNIASPYFLNYMNLSLQKYQDFQSVFSVSGYNYPIKMPGHYPYDVYFYSGFSAWGVGYWRDKYQQYYNEYRTQPEKYISEKKQLINAYKKYSYQGHRILIRDINGEISANDAKVCFYQFCNEMVSIFPLRSLTRNTGHDGSGKNCRLDYTFLYQEIDIVKRDYKFPVEIIIDQQINKRLTKYFSNLAKKKKTLKRWLIDPILFKYKKIFLNHSEHII